LEKPFIDRLATAVAIPSVSADASYRPKVHEMGDWLAKELETLGVT
jgi:Cys-Gly metallodipeptidase DUG1